jgi:adenylate cyclase
MKSKMTATNDDRLIFAPETEEEGERQSSFALANSPLPRSDSWKILIVDDEPDIHRITKLALADLSFDGRPLQFISAYSRAETLQLMAEQADIALILLDVVMETEHAGLEAIHYIREKLGNRLARIILRTGQPGQAPERQVIVEYDINDYKAKAELTAQKLFTAVVVALRSYRDMTTIEGNRRELSALANASNRFVPHEILSFLHRNNIAEVCLGDQVEAEMTILFADVRAFTTLSEQMSPKENFNFINALLRRLGPVIREQGGFVDKYLGDGLMALFPASTDSALQAALAMRRQLNDYNGERIASGKVPIKIGVGLHTGKLMLGIVGEAERLQGTVISDAVNLAGRMEGLTKLYGAAIMLSEQTLLNLEDPMRYCFRFMDKVQVKGKQEVVSVYEIFDEDSAETVAAKLATRPAFQEGLRLYQGRNFKAARDRFEEVLAYNPHDQAAQLYLRRAAHFLAQGAPDNWTGVATVTEELGHGVRQ